MYLTTCTTLETGLQFGRGVEVIKMGRGEAGLGIVRSRDVGLHGSL